MAHIELTQEFFFTDKDLNTHIAILDGNCITSSGIFYKSIASALLFPDYYEHNLDSLEELINDLDWIESEFKLLVVTNFSEFLKNNKNLKDKILDILKESDNNRLKIWLK